VDNLVEGLADNGLKVVRLGQLAKVRLALSDAKWHVSMIHLKVTRIRTRLLPTKQKSSQDATVDKRGLADKGCIV
jgi:hypothetical protein